MQACDPCLTPVSGYKEIAGWDGKGLTTCDTAQEGIGLAERQPQRKDGLFEEVSWGKMASLYNHLSALPLAMSSLGAEWPWRECCGGLCGATPQAVQRIRPSQQILFRKEIWQHTAMATTVEFQVWTHHNFIGGK